MKNETQPSRLRCACMCARRKSWLMPMKMPSRIPAIASRMAVRKNKDGIDTESAPSMRVVRNTSRPYAREGRAHVIRATSASGARGGLAGREHDDGEQHEADR